MIYIFDNQKPEIGRDSYVSDLASVIGNVSIGDNCYIGHGAVLRGDYGRIEVGSGTAVEEGVMVHAPPDGICKIGKKVTIGHGAIIHGKSIGDFSVIGMGAVVSIYAEIGERSIVAEGGIVKRNQIVDKKVVVAGNPAEFVREITPEDEKIWERGKQIYLDLAKKYLTIGMQQI
ncbi:MAG: gamma carbonic anhydrase family protein [Deltaproteobacteria bacterium]|nr:gamma carbonic anhydrase family protein [Deltaproteobacteria bacterium]